MAKKSSSQSTSDSENKKMTLQQEADNKKEAQKCNSCGNVVLFLVVLSLYVLLGYNAYEINALQHNIEHTYVYNMEAVLMQTGLADENRKFETNMADLEKEIDAAEKKVKSMKDEKLRQEYRDMYMKSLTLKRNTLVEEHEKFMKSLLKNVKKTLAEVAKENDVKVIFNRLFLIIKR